jgi:quercetin dioxygenase-like cupin family protein
MGATKGFFAINDLLEEVKVPGKGIFSQTIFKDDRIRVVLFAFAEGEELTEHTASVPAIIHVLKGEARITLGEESLQALPGTWIHMQPNLSHSIYTTSPFVMLLTLLT